MKIVSKKEIQMAIDLSKDLPKLLENQKAAFKAFSNQEVLTPIPLQFSFQNPRGDCHIKAGDSCHHEFLVIKIANGFYENFAVSDGLIILLSKSSGKIEAILYDAGWLTQLRTAIATLIAIQITPFDFDVIGLIGTGQQAQFCLELLIQAYPEKKFYLAGRNHEKTQHIFKKFKSMKKEISIEISKDIKELTEFSQIILTATASTQAFLTIDNLTSKTHIIALGADEKGKQEIAPEVFKKADLVIADSIDQISAFGDSSYAIKEGFIAQNDIKELGNILQHPLSEIAGSNILVTDLTGIAAQDVFLSNLIYQKVH